MSTGDEEHESVTTTDRLAERVLGCFMLTLGTLGATAGVLVTFVLANGLPEDGVPVKTAAVLCVLGILLTTATMLALWSGLSRLLGPPRRPRR